VPSAFLVKPQNELIKSSSYLGESGAAGGLRGPAALHDREPLGWRICRLARPQCAIHDPREDLRQTLALIRLLSKGPNFPACPPAFPVCSVIFTTWTALSPLTCRFPRDQSIRMTLRSCVCLYGSDMIFDTIGSRDMQLQGVCASPFAKGGTLYPPGRQFLKCASVGEGYGTS
jgi:hypothetical protein